MCDGQRNAPCEIARVLSSLVKVRPSFAEVDSNSPSNSSSKLVGQVHHTKHTTVLSGGGVAIGARYTSESCEWKNRTNEESGRDAHSAWSSSSVEIASPKVLSTPTV
jgi:hypothetical protein